MKKFMTTLALCLALPGLADSVPGFEDPAVYDDVMNGTIRVEEVLANNVESTMVIRSFFPKATADLYVDVATNHKNYPNMVAEIKEAKTTSVNAERTEWTYWMHMVVKVLFFTEQVYPEGKQIYSRPVDAVSEGVLTHTVANYADLLKSMVERSRLIPHQGGILVHDYVNYALVKPNSNAGAIRKQLKDHFVRLIKAYRKETAGRRH